MESKFNSPSRSAASDPQDATGNTAFTTELKQQGKLGLFFRRQQTIPKAVPFYINVNNFYSSIKRTLQEALDHLSHFNTKHLSRIDSLSSSLASGCCLLAYLKVRNIVITECSGTPDPNSLIMPRADPDIPIPAPYAFAIQHLGIVRLTDLSSDLRVYPCFPRNGHKYGLPTNVCWNPNEYAHSVEYAKKLGMRFASVDLAAKKGSAWWLFRQSYADGGLKLKCTYPEVNFTEQMAVVHTLFLAGNEDDLIDGIVSFENQTTVGDYGSMLRDCHPVGLGLSSFQALSDMVP